MAKGPEVPTYIGNGTGTFHSDAGETFTSTWLAPKIGQRIMEHEAWCEALTDPPGFAEVVATELRRLAAAVVVNEPPPPNLWS